MSHEHSDPIAHPEVQLASAGRYTIGYVITLALMFVSSGLVMGRLLSPEELAAATGVIALAAVLAQFYFLFRLDLSETQIWHTVALLLTVPLFILAIGLTVWMFHTLALHTMFPGTGM